MVLRVTARTDVRDKPVETRPITLPLASTAAPPEEVGYTETSSRTNGLSFPLRHDFHLPDTPLTIPKDAMGLVSAVRPTASTSWPTFNVASATSSRGFAFPVS